MRTSIVFASLFFLLLATRAPGLRRLDMELHAGLDKEKIPDSKWRQHCASRPLSRCHRASDGQHILAPTTGEQPMSSGHGDTEEDGEVKRMMRSIHTVAPRLFHEDYAGPSGHSPNHHRTNPCGPC
ncbi:hypothetical protein ACP70R_002999 [Stipagrostis hirtigluma subsp. patula]